MGAFPTNIPLSVESAVALIRVLRFHTRGNALNKTYTNLVCTLPKDDPRLENAPPIVPYGGYVTGPDYPHGALLITRGTRPENPQFVTIRVPLQEVILLTRIFRWHAVGDGVRDIYDTLIGTLVEMKVGTGDIKPLLRYHSTWEERKNTYFISVPGYLTGKKDHP